jgi:hypothetical protein
MYWSFCDCFIKNINKHKINPIQIFEKVETIEIIEKV